LTFEVSAQLFLGGDLENNGEELGRLVHDWVAGLMSLPVPLPWTTYGRALRNRKKLLTFVQGAIELRRKESTQDALGLLVGCRDENGSTLSADELSSQALFLVAAGYATTTSLLTSMALALAIHPIVRRRAVEEQERFGGASPVTPEQIREMTYLDQVLLEVERLYPPASFGFRGVQSSFFFGGTRRLPIDPWTCAELIDADEEDRR
jgi:cytochrome P450